jgi:hypothetical protein
LTAPVPSARKTRVVRFAGLKIASATSNPTKQTAPRAFFGEIIFSYTRAQAIADRVLIDVTPTAVETGFRFPTALTGDLMAAIETIPQQYPHEDIEGRLGDLLWMGSLAAWRAKPGVHGSPLR